MRPGGLPGASNFPNLLPFFHSLPLGYDNPGMVHVFCHQPVPVIDHHPVPGAVGPSSDGHGPVIRCISRGTNRRGIIIALMSAHLKLSDFPKVTGLCSHSRTGMGELSAPDRAAQAVVDTLTWHQAGAAVNTRSFVLEAEALTFRDGTRVYVSSTTNFIAVDGDRGVVQISPSRFLSGPNGVGGVTLDGRVTGFTVTSGKNDVVHIRAGITGAGISAEVDISLYPGSNEAYAVISPNFNSRTIRLEGRLVPYEQSRVYEGMSF